MYCKVCILVDEEYSFCNWSCRLKVRRKTWKTGTEPEFRTNEVLGSADQLKPVLWVLHKYFRYLRTLNELLQTVTRIDSDPGYFSFRFITTKLVTWITCNGMITCLYILLVTATLRRWPSQPSRSVVVPSWYQSHQHSHGGLGLLSKCQWSTTGQRCQRSTLMSHIH